MSPIPTREYRGGVLPPALKGAPQTTGLSDSNVDIENELLRSYFQFPTFKNITFIKIT